MNLAAKIDNMLPKDIYTLLKKIGLLSDKLGYSSFVVGGLVRDLLLGIANFDLDIVVEGDAIELGRALSDKLGGSMVAHKRFGTATVATKDGLKIDLATARVETYVMPAALPAVEFSSLKDDLIRRDFTINAMAISLGKDDFGRLIDYFGGEDDLAHGRIKAMHDLSFMDDPTRIFRAVRFENRFGFKIDKHTEALIRNAIKEEIFSRVSTHRIHKELTAIMKEKEPLKVLSRIAELHWPRPVHSKIKLDPAAKMIEGLP